MLTETPTLAGATSTPLERTIATSGLLDGLSLHRASSFVAAQHPTSPEDHDRRLAEHLVESDLLGSWQVEQLKRGRTKFTLGPYRILDSIARGGMGHLFKGEHELLGRVEAIKVLPRVKSTPESVASFRHEIRAQAALDHPNLVKVYNAGRDRETYYLVTEFVRGIDLRRLVRRSGVLDESLAAWVVGQAAEAIDHAHRRGFVHRDVKPGNLLITPAGGVKVTDLGLAWCLNDLTGSSSVYVEGKIAGTSDYLAPEAIRNPDRVRPESDLYGLGCTLYYALSGKVPFPGGTHLDKLRRRLREEPIDLARLAPGVSDSMIDLVRSLMAPEPADRPATAGDVALALKSLAGDSARSRLAELVSDQLVRRVRPEDTTPDGAVGESVDELPETVSGLPLHEVARDETAAEPPSSPHQGGTPVLITAAALGAAALIAAAAAWSRWAS